MVKTQTDNLTGDQVYWIQAALHRRDDAVKASYPRISRAKECADLAFIIELCEITGMRLDEQAKNNALPVEVREGCNGG